MKTINYNLACRLGNTSSEMVTQQAIKICPIKFLSMTKNSRVQHENAVFCNNIHEKITPF